jgi:hypothetical protein
VSIKPGLPGGSVHEEVVDEHQQVGFSASLQTLEQEKTWRIPIPRKAPVNRLDHPLRIGSGVGKVKEVGWAGLQFASAPVIDIRQVDDPFNAFLAENFSPRLKNVGVAHHSSSFPEKRAAMPQKRQSRRRGVWVNQRSIGWLD